MVVDMAGDIEVHMVANMEVDKVADMAANKSEVDICTKTKLHCMHVNKNEEPNISVSYCKDRGI